MRGSRDDRGDAELLTAYVDGVAELSLDERKRIDDLLARDPALRAAERETRDLLGTLRELPPAGGEPDWTALERSIGEAVGTEVPLPWYARLRWRFIVPSIALATTAAIVALVVHDPQPPQPQPLAEETQLATEDGTDVARDDELALALDESLPLMLDGTDLEVALDAAELFDLEWELDAEAVPETASLLPPTNLEWLEWIDELDGESLDHVERLLDHNPRRGRG